MESQMVVRCLIIVSGLIAAVPAVAQSAESQAAARNADNWAIFQKLYPARALAAHEEGTVGFKVTIDKKGTVTGCQVTRTSGHPLLDQETCSLITLNAEFQPEEGLSGSQVRTRDGMITWKLPSGTAQPGPSQVLASADAPEKVICKKSVRTGTLAGFERTCMTQREWTRQSDDAKEQWGEVQGKKGATHGN
jgi:TonB family protein